MPWILGGVGALLIVNIGVLLWVLARPSPAPAAAPAGSPPARIAEAPPVLSPRPIPAKVRPLSAETEAGADPELEERPPPPPPRVEAYAAEKAAAAREFAQPHVSVAGLPSIHQLPAQATAGLPALNLDLHVYSGDPAQRFVIINGQRLHEGDTLKEGPAVERITPDGAIINHQGTRFLLPRE
jgi:general secretion pathway protein B